MYALNTVFLIHSPKTLQFQLFLERCIPMKGNSPDSNQPSFLLPSLKEQLSPKHPIYKLNERINWSVIEEDFKKLYSHTGRPASAGPVDGFASAPETT